LSDEHIPGLTFGDVSEPIPEAADELIELTVKVPRRAAAAILQHAEEEMDNALVECSFILPASR